MNMRILFIAPYSGLQQLASSVIEEYKDIQIDVYQGNYEEGPKLLKELKAAENYSAIITRGGTVEMCRRATTIPIIEIYMNAFDMIRIIKLSEGYQGKKMLVAHSSIVKSFNQLSELLEFSVQSQCYAQHKEVRGLLEEQKKEGCELIIGDHIVYQTALELGMKSILLTSGAEGIRSAIEEAVRLCGAISQDKNHTSLANNDIEDTTIEPVNTDDFITVLNANELSPRFVQTVFPQSIVTQLTELSGTSLPTIITGEDGMCKSDAGYLCCCYGPQKRKPLVTVRCYSIPEDYSFDVLDRVVMEHVWSEGGTLFLEDIDQLHKEGQKKLLHILKKLHKDSRVKILVSCELPVELCVSSGRLLRQLRSLVDEVRIELMPFKSYTNEIQNMISLCLAKLDESCASQVVGIKEGGIKALSDYDWPGNVRQFMRVIKQLTLTCNGSYITESQVRSAIKKERDSYEHAALVPIDLSGSLKEIEARIIQHIMAEEGMNQVKVEKRLEIGHSTLWRKLK